MNAKHRRTLGVVFARPTTSTLEWARVEALLEAVGCRVIEGRGSRVRFEFQGQILSIHRPHPDREARPYQVELVREFLLSMGVTP